MQLSGTATGASLNSTTTALSGPTTLTADQSASYTVKVTSSASGTPTGTVIFKDGTTTLTTVALDTSASATYTTSQLSAGTHTITASYSGDFSLRSLSIRFIVRHCNRDPHHRCHNRHDVYSQPRAASIFATASYTVATATPATPTVRSPSRKAQQPSPQSRSINQAEASFITSSLSVGIHNIVAYYSGDAIFTASQSAVLPVTVTTSASTITLTGPSTLAIGQSGAFTAAVKSSSGGGTPTGNVTFKDGTTALTTVSLDGSASATLHYYFALRWNAFDNRGL